MKRLLALSLFLSLFLVVLTAVVPAMAAQVADLTWTDNSTNETGFKIFRKLGAAGSPELIATTAANAVAFTDAGPLVDGTQYCWIVLATNALGDAARRAGDEGCAISGAIPLGATGVNVNIRVAP